MVASDRGQALTFEGVIAGILLLAAIGFALQVTAVTPLSPSTSSQHVENQLQATGEGVLTSSAQTGALEETILYWDAEAEEGRFHGAGDATFYRSGPPDTSFGDELSAVLGSRNVAYNVYIHYQTAEDVVQTQQLLSQGRPSDHAVSFSRSVTLLDSDHLVLEDGSEGQRLDAVDFYMPDASTDDTVYNLARVEVVAWRI